ncbi:pyridoxal phosphate-dependent aminotransferase [Cuneatibacter sp. NSJ-177]|uniref:pyridoxal phosphate-dependent aminotransferase n=1 Tax=Cuneatibacter sp. NSJ-177 TaxID=2931401 RepID=UPI001FD1D192|nr:pyridoxal phosphate-dependent aminotransferase [Cuneatibacter sp. NSJ-177]MCJ7834115.1 pyridoxal phosphate-dependent aminotransferase [Cuneatibacter sp. NSJ-177]
MHFSKEIGESLTYKFAQAVGEMKAQGREIISLGLGEPDFTTPDYVIDATIAALKGGHTHYSATQGLPELRKKIAERATADYGVSYDASEVIVLPGIKPAVYDALAAILEPFDEVINITPYYVSYPSMIKLAEPTAEIVSVPLNKDYTLNTDTLKAAFNKNTKAILVNSPHNPTGMVFSKDEVEMIIRLCLENDTYLIADEVYEKLTFSGNVFTSFAKYAEIKDRLVFTNGYSKSHAMTGWRLGYAVGPKSLIVKMNKIQQHVNTNTCTFIQKGACSIYDHVPEHLVSYVKALEDRVTYFDKAVQDIKIFKGTKPKAGFFYFVDISATGMDSNTFCVKLLQETGIATTPGLAFGYDWDDHVRFSLAVPMATLEKAVGLIKDFVEKNT